MGEGKPEINSQISDYHRVIIIDSDTRKKSNIALHYITLNCIALHCIGEMVRNNH